MNFKDIQLPGAACGTLCVLWYWGDILSGTAQLNKKSHLEKAQGLLLMSVELQVDNLPWI